MNSTTNRNLGRIVDLVENDQRFAAEAAAFDLVQNTVAGLKRMRKRAGLTQTQLAKRLGITQGRVAQIESGLMDHAPNLDMVARYAQVCGMIAGVELHTRQGSAPTSLVYEPGALARNKIVPERQHMVVDVVVPAAVPQATSRSRVETVSSGQLAARLATRHKMSYEAASAFLEDMVGIITKSLNKVDRVRWTDFGVLRVGKRTPLADRNAVEPTETKASRKTAPRTTDFVKSRVL